ncbi:MAG: class B sortase [Clostridiales bacterium]|nr:class B sortase [Clostridiales bacterium]
MCIINGPPRDTPKSGGSIFIGCRCSPGLDTFHTIIYGHRMNNNSMFGTLKYYRNQDFWREHPTIYIVDNSGVHQTPTAPQPSRDRSYPAGHGSQGGWAAGTHEKTGGRIWPSVSCVLAVLLVQMLESARVGAVPVSISFSKGKGDLVLTN